MTGQAGTRIVAAEERMNQSNSCLFSVTSVVNLFFSALLALVLGFPATTVRAGPDTGLKAPDRIVSLAPSLTETVFALGDGGRLVGVTDYCDHPPEVSRIARVGGFVNPNLEAIIALRPDLVLAVPNGGAKALVERLEQLGIGVLIVQVYTLADIDVAIREVGSAIRAPDRAEALITRMHRSMESVEELLRGRPRRRVVLVWEQQPLIVGGAGTYIDELIRKAGGENIAAAGKGRFPHYGIEEVVARGPEVILDAFMLSDASAASSEARRRFWDRWPTIPAVRTGEVHFIETFTVVRPGPRIPEALEILARAIHPEAFTLISEAGP